MALVALGCRVARSDLEALAAELEGGFEIAARGERADVVVVSTCAVTCDAEAAARQAIRRSARDHPGARIVASGCCAELRPEELRTLPGVAAVVGTRAGVGVAEVVRRMAGRGEGEGRGEGRIRSRRERTRAFLKVQDGCDCRCAYCVVPLARGPESSLRFDAALAAVAALGRDSPEVVLTGVRLGAYGRDLAPRRTLSDLVLAAADRGLASRVRLSSIDPLEVPVELLEGPARHILCEHVHLPLQSGSRRILASMRRPYGPEEYAHVVRRLEEAVPGLCVGTDVMTGFPGETEEDHRATVALVEALPIAYLHVFPFSPRPGTAAASMRPGVPQRVARERASELMAISERRWAAFCAAQVGRLLEVAVERVAGGFARGTAREYVTVRWPAGGERRGGLVQVRVTAVEGEACLGVREPTPRA